MENEQTKINVTLGYTLNLGNFQSLRLDLGVIDHLRDGENIDSGFERVYAFVEKKLEREDPRSFRRNRRVMAERKDRMALLSRYSKLHTFHYEEKALLNLNVEQWAADALIESYGIQYCYEIMQYYFDVADKPTWKYFAYNTDDIINARRQQEQDKLERAQRRQMAKAWLGE